MDTSSFGKLGFGMMRLPQKDDVIDVETTSRMVDTFLEAGFNYFDTAWAYPGSEEAVCRALVQRHPRSSFKLATKLAAWRVDSREKAVAQFATSLEKTGAGYFDCYLLHNLGEHRTKFYDDYGIWDFVAEMKRQGLVRHMGFSFHSTAEELDALLQAHPEAEFVQLQINYADWDSPTIQSRACLEVARRHKKPVIVMEPVKGGLLANPPESVRKVFARANPDRSPASWALRFAAGQEGVMTVLSGMSTLEQVLDNIASLRGFSAPGDEERAVVAQAREKLQAIPIVPCTSCNYCAEVCPADIGVSGSFTALNLLTLYGSMAAAKREENWLVALHHRRRANLCEGCGSCEEVCPQHIAIRSELARFCEAMGFARG